MQKMRVEQAKESRDITSLTREFTQKLSLVEGQLKEAIKVDIIDFSAFLELPLL